VASSAIYTREVGGGTAFFDLDRTLLSRSSSLALAGAFWRQGLILRRELARAAGAQLLFARFGAREETVRRMTERGMAVLAELPVGEVRRLVAESMEPVLKPLVYREALDLVRSHAAVGEPTYLVSGALQEVVQALAEELGLDGAIGSRCGIVDGVYTGRLEFACYGAAKAAALRELAVQNGIDLSASTAYSDAHTDLALLEAVGRPIAVNPDRELRAVADERGWPVRRFRGRAFETRERRPWRLVVAAPALVGTGVAAYWASRRRDT
jgi:HAD superfamily hydrolase (TIGR01490 family)